MTERNDHWHTYRQNVKILLVSFTSAPFVVMTTMVIAAVLPEALGVFRRYLVYLSVMFVFLAIVSSSNAITVFPCPRCHKRFFSKWYVCNPLAKRCLHCGFAKWGDPNATEDTVDGNRMDDEPESKAG